MIITANRKKLDEMSLEDLKLQAGLAAWFLINEAVAKGGTFTTAPLSTEGFFEKEFELEFDTLLANPNQPLNLIIKERNVEETIRVSGTDCNSSGSDS